MKNSNRTQRTIELYSETKHRQRTRASKVRKDQRVESFAKLLIRKKKKKRRGKAMGENRGLAAPWHDTPTILACARAQGSRREGEGMPLLLSRRRSRTKRERDLRVRGLPGRRLAAALALFCSWNRGQSIGDDTPAPPSRPPSAKETPTKREWGEHVVINVRRWSHVRDARASPSPPPLSIACVASVNQLIRRARKIRDSI